MERLPNHWDKQHNEIDPIRYECGYCGTDTTPAYGWQSEHAGDHSAYVPICTDCNRPSFIVRRGAEITSATPAPLMGESVRGLPKDIGTLYDEARKCTGVGAYTAAVLACRKILMHVAVEKEAEEGLSFKAYVNYLADNNYIPPGSKGWVDHIRDKANEANHEIVLMSPDTAADLITFTEMLLRLMYEFPERLPKKDEQESEGEAEADQEAEPETPAE